MFIEQFFIEGLGCASYAVGCAQAGTAAVIDPDRDVQKYLDFASAKGLKITHIIETHLHADHVSGNTELAARTGARIYVHEASGAEFDYQPLKHGDVIRLGNINLNIRHTPGHTPESITLLVADTTRSAMPWLALTGDTLFVGDMGRPDLVGVEAARELAGQMHDSLSHEILPHTDGLLIYPGHGAGSLCGKSIGAVRSSTLGFERATNPALQPRSRADFIEFATQNLPEQPGNFKRIKQTNRRGPKVLGDVMPHPLNAFETVINLKCCAALLDTRSKDEYMRKHIPGSIHLEADDQLSNRIGFVLPPDTPIILIVDNEAAYRRVVYSLARVGYETVNGYLSESIDAWEAQGLPVTSGDIQDIQPQDLWTLLQSSGATKPQVIDVREPWEYAQGHIPGALLVPLGSLMVYANTLDSQQPIAVICASGSRSQSAAALLGQKGVTTVYNVVGGTSQWARTGLPLEMPEMG